MLQKISNNKLLILIGLTVAAAFVRLIPHPPNFAPIAAMALFGGAYFSKKWMAFAIPFAAMLVTDLFLGFHGTMWAVYLSFAAIVVLGMVMIKTVKISNVFLASIASSVLFFVVTNFGVWLTGGGFVYPKTIAGLMATYTAAIPFFYYTLLGDLFFVGLMFGAYEIAKAKVPQLQEVKVNK